MAVVETCQEAKIDCSKGSKSSGEVSAQVEGQGASASGSVNSKTSTQMTLAKGSVLAYECKPLRINMDTGDFELLYIAKDDAKGKIKGTESERILQNLELILAPLSNATIEERHKFKAGLLGIMTNTEDINALADLFLELEFEGEPNRVTFERQLRQKDAVWSFLTAVGITHVDDILVADPNDLQPLAHAVCDALSDIGSSDMQCIRKCEKIHQDILLRLIRLAIRGDKIISFEPVEAEYSIYIQTDPVDAILTAMDFIVDVDKKIVTPPELKTSILEGMYCVLQCIQ